MPNSRISKSASQSRVPQQGPYKDLNSLNTGEPGVVPHVRKCWLGIQYVSAACRIAHRIAFMLLRQLLLTASAGPYYGL